MLHVRHLVAQRILAPARADRFRTRLVRPVHRRLIGARIFIDLDIALLAHHHAPLGLLGPQAQRHHHQLVPVVLQDDARLIVHARWRHFHRGQHLMRCRIQEPARKGRGIDTNVQQRPAGQIAAEEAALRIQHPPAPEVHLHQPHPAQRPRIHQRPQPAVQRHVIDGHRLGHHHALRACQQHHLGQLPGVQRDGLLAQHVLAGLHGRLHPGVVGVVRRGDVDHVQVRILQHGLGAGMHAADAVAPGQRPRRFLAAAGNGLDAPVDGLQRRRHAIGRRPCAQDAPAP